MKKIAYICAFPLVIALGFKSTEFTSDNDKRLNFTVGDSSFLTSASQANLAEIEAGRLAVSMSTKDAVKQIGQMMVNDHTIAQNELAALAQNQNITLPTETDGEHKNMIDQLSKLSGTAFDSSYLRSQLIDHQMAITLFEQEAQNGKDDSVRAYAQKYLPKLKDHLKMIKKHKSMPGDEKMGM